MASSRYDDMEAQAERDRRRMKSRLAMIMTLLTLIGFVILLIWSEGEAILPTDAQGEVKDASETENGEIIHPTENDAPTAQESTLEEIVNNTVMDPDGGYWVIEAFPVPEEWRKK